MYNSYFFCFLYPQLSNINKIHDKKIKNLNTMITTIDNQIHNLLNSIKDSIDPTLVVDEVNRLKIDKENLVIKLSNLKNSMNSKVTIKRKDIEEYFYNFRKLFENSTLNKKELLTTFVSNILLNKKEHQLEIILYFQWCLALEQIVGIVAMRHLQPKLLYFILFKHLVSLHKSYHYSKKPH